MKNPLIGLQNKSKMELCVPDTVLTIRWPIFKIITHHLKSVEF